MYSLCFKIVDVWFDAQELRNTLLPKKQHLKYKLKQIQPTIGHTVFNKAKTNIKYQNIKYFETFKTLQNIIYFEMNAVTNIITKNIIYKLCIDS